MRTQDIVKSLSNLEQSLQGVESARQQVEKTVAAYGATQKQLAALEQEFAHVSNDLRTITDLIRDNQQELSGTLSSKVEHLLAQMEGKVEQLENKATMISQTFETSCKASAQTLNAEMDAFLVTFQGKVADELSDIASAMEEFKSLIKAIRQDFEKDINLTISSIQENSQKIADSFRERIGNHLSSLSNLNTELAEIVKLQKKQNSELLTKVEAELTTIKASITDIDSQLKGIQSDQDHQHQELIELLSALLQGNSPSAERLTARFNTVDGSLGVVKDGVSSVSTQLGTATNQIIDHNKQALLAEVNTVKTENAVIKKLVIFCLIVATIAVILNIVMLFK